MAVQTRNITEIYGKEVFTDAGQTFGVVEEAIIAGNKIHSWRIKATRGSFLSRVLSGARGVIVPHQLVKAVNDVMIISRNAVPSYEEDDDMETATVIQ